MTELDKKLRRYLTSRLRQIFYRSPIRTEFKKRNTHCEICKVKFTTQNPIKVDHRVPVVPVDRDIASLEYFIRLFCLDLRTGMVNISNLSANCEMCHRRKSNQETSERAKYETGPYSKESKERSRATREKRKKKNL